MSPAIFVLITAIPRLIIAVRPRVFRRSITILRIPTRASIGTRAPRTRVIPPESFAITYHYSAWLLELQPRAMFATRLPYAISFPLWPSLSLAGACCTPRASLPDFPPRISLSPCLFHRSSVSCFYSAVPSLIIRRIRCNSHSYGTCFLTWTMKFYQVVLCNVTYLWKKAFVAMQCKMSETRMSVSQTEISK